MEIPELREEDFTRYYATEKIGGEAIVYKGNHFSYGDVALKKYRKAFCDDEIKILKENVYHPNIVRIIGILTDSSTPPRRIGYIMSYMKMGSLDNIIHDKSTSCDDIYTSEQITIWIIKICCGLSYLHSRKIIHRDIKPSNVLLGESYNDVQLSDFGIARSISSLTRSLTTGRGTPVYMAPEIFESGKYNFSADIYSLSITIWEILHRRIPSNHLSKTSDGERPQVNNNLSKEVSDLLTICWDNDSSKRPTIHYVLDFCKKTTFSLIDPENFVNECTASFEHLDVHNDESSSKTIIGKIFEKLKQVFPANNAESTNVQNKLTVDRTRASSNNELLPQIVFEKPDENFHISKPIEQSPEEQTILLLGGIEKSHVLNTLLMLENNEQNWKELNIKLPYAIFYHGAQFLNNNLYIFGGSHSNCTYKLSKSLQWEKMADMNQKRCYISNSSVILNNQIWVCGGFSDKSVEMYDPETNEWKEMNEYRKDAAVAVVNGKIFCCGGWDRKVELDSVELNSVECCDPSSDVWTTICNMPQEIREHGAVEINGHLTVIGGYNGKKYLKNVWTLDTTGKSAVWIEKPSMSIQRRGFSIAKIDGKIFVCGGKSKGESIDGAEIFDGEAWRKGPRMSAERIYASAVVIPMEFARYLKQITPVTIKEESSGCSVQ